MDAAVIESNVLEEQWTGVAPTLRVVEGKKKSFEEAVAECGGRPASEFFDELRRQVKMAKRYCSSDTSQTTTLMYKIYSFKFKVQSIKTHP